LSSIVFLAREHGVIEHNGLDLKAVQLGPVNLLLGLVHGAVNSIPRYRLGVLVVTAKNHVHLSCSKERKV
jgi:hypothetical protein